jgi:hypothetical protein
MQPAERDTPLLKDMNKPPGRQVRRGIFFEHYT